MIGQVIALGRPRPSVEPAQGRAGTTSVRHGLGRGNGVIRRAVALGRPRPSAETEPGGSVLRSRQWLKRDAFQLAGGGGELGGVLAGKEALGVEEFGVEDAGAGGSADGVVAKERVFDAEDRAFAQASDR